jgi:hypothetical protein
MFFVQWVLYPYVLKALIYKGFSHTHSFALVINTTVSTWPELPLLMSAFLGTGQLFFSAFTVFGNISTIL